MIHFFAMEAPGAKIPREMLKLPNFYTRCTYGRRM